jgi:primosomal replication protein N''
MMIAAPDYVKICPRCRQERRPNEMSCEGVVEGLECKFPLEDVEIRVAGSGAIAGPTAGPVLTCANGHLIEPGDEVCLICGADAIAVPAVPATGFGETPQDGYSAEPVAATIIDGWSVERTASSRGNDAIDRYVVLREPGSREALLSLYREGSEPDPAVYEVLRRMPLDHIPELLATGRHEGRAFDVVELITQGSLAQAGFIGADDGNVLRRLAEELGRALADFTEQGLRHRDLRPDAILLRMREPLDLVITDFGSARLSDFDLEAVAPLQLTRYSAPEAIVGTVSAASDWWSLGMIILEQATAGGCFEGVNEQAFRLHVVTRGIDIPAGIDANVRVLLRGLLARDPLKRWAAPQLFAWLKGEPVSAEDMPEPPIENGPVIALNERSYTSPDLFSLAAAGSDNWEAARVLAMSGVVATWLSERKSDSRTVAEVRRLISEQNLTEDFRLALVLMAMNPALPLTLKGEIVTPAWLLSHPQDGYEVVTGEVGKQLERMDRETWIIRLRARAIAVRERAKLLEVDLDEERLRTVLLATSRANLEAERAGLRCVYPDSDHAGLTSILERPRISDEDLIILISANPLQFTPIAALIDKAMDLAGETGVTLDRAQIQNQLVEPRREIFGRIDQRIANFSRCGVHRVDEWADSFRIERRLALPRAMVLLAVPAGLWEAPKGQQYVASLLEHLEKRVAGTIARGPLVRFTIGKTTPRVDIFELGTGQRPGESLLDHVLSRADAPMPIDPAGLLADPQREARLRRLASHAHTFRRDTGIDGRYLGFPFVLVRDARMTSTKARIAPVLLWPVVLDVANGAGRTATLMFDRDREEIRLNPALEGLFGTQEFGRWKAAREDLLARGTFKIRDVMDVFGGLAAPMSRELAAVPSKDTSIPSGSCQLAPAGALFNAEFTGQAVANDLRQMRQTPPAGTSLDAMLRIPDAPKTMPTIPTAREQDRYVVVESDPSQDSAILQARVAPGLLVEGPPGTGKSQTIVNIIADAMGRGETVLIVCQKYSALKVVHKRLEAVGLDNRSFLLVDTTRDRQGVINALQDQLSKIQNIPAGRVASLRHKRIEHAARIEAIEAQLDRHHSALHALDSVSGASYRMLISELVGVESDGHFVVATALRQFFAKSGRSLRSAIEETCAPLARLWLSSAYERNPLHILRPFAVDDAIESDLSAALAEFSTAEVRRCAILAKGDTVFEIDDPAPYREWLQASRPIFETMTQITRQGVMIWLDLFQPRATGDDSGSIGHGLIERLDQIKTALLALNANAHDDGTFDAIAALAPAELLSHRLDARGATGTASFWRIVTLARWSQRRRVRAYLATLGEEGSLPRIGKLRDALDLEDAVRPLREDFANVKKALRLNATTAPLSINVLRREIDRLLAVLRPVEAAATVALRCPRPADGQAMARAGTVEAFAGLARTYQEAFARHVSRVSSRSILEKLSGWFKEEWVARCVEVIVRGEPTDPSLSPIMSALPTLQSYQRFRARVDELGVDALGVFAVLRGNENQLKAFAPVELEGVIRRTIRREALLSWKARVEESTPELLLEREETKSKIINLARLDDEMRKLNRELLAIDIEPARLGSAANWQSILRLRGPQARSLRGIFDEGNDLGLMSLRPIWLMNPDVASRVLPLKAGQFDLVIFDEASQIPVEYAAPSLFRAKRTVISGDDKQMPPSSFFASRIDDDGAEEGLDSDAALDDAATEAERAVFEEAWNRREVKDCPDLLQLGRGILPTCMLQIHYRSNYRELIDYSNAAFYKAGLSVPVRHPTAEIRRVRPIEVIQVDGVYEKQTNKAEAQRIVDLLADLWRDAANPCGSVGVVSFNRKQADLIEEAIEARAEIDPEFLRAYTRERDRTQDGEDMGFFVKNVENVQGDERDIIIFSTTFGRDPNGTFRKSFGVLGQTGGERRLNVAVTRARDKVVIVTSMPVNGISDWLERGGRALQKPRDYLQAYLAYANKMSAGDVDIGQEMAARLGNGRGPTRHEGTSLVQDGLAQSVERSIREMGFSPVSVQHGDAFGLDFAIEDPRTGLFGIGIECDAPRHDLLQRARAREIWRPNVLRRAIRSVHRITSSAWYENPQEEVGRLRAALAHALTEPERGQNERA